MSDDHSGHFIIPVKYYIITLVALLILTFITVWIAQFDFGSLTIYIAMAVAVVKASFVILFFMGMRWEEGFNIVILIGTLLFVGLFLCFVLFDVFTRDQVFENEGNILYIKPVVNVVSEYSTHHSDDHHSEDDHDHTDHDHSDHMYNHSD